MSLSLSAWAQELVPRENVLTVGSRYCIVKQVFDVRLPSGEQDLVVPGVPPQAELDSLALELRRGSIDLLHWHRADRVVSSQAAPGLALDRQGDMLTWTPGAPEGREGVADGVGDVACRVDVSSRGNNELYVRYMVPGMEWLAQYQVIIREAMSSGRAVVSLDMTLDVLLSNPTPAVFENTLINLVGAETYSDGKGQVSDMPGIWEMDPGNPMSDLWLGTGDPPEPMYFYALPKRVTIPANGEFLFTMAEVVRKPARKVFRMTRLEVPSDLESPQPLRRMIYVPNIEKVGLGLVLPPGPVDIFSGGHQSQFLTRALLPRTPVNGDLAFDMGLASEVTGLKRRLERVPGIRGYVEESYEVVLNNDLEEEVDVEVIVEPVRNLRWKLARATEKSVIDEREIRFALQVKPGSTHRFEYRLRIQEPE